LDWGIKTPLYLSSVKVSTYISSPIAYHPEIEDPFVVLFGSKQKEKDLSFDATATVRLWHM
jgi:hypothetical protein